MNQTQRNYIRKKIEDLFYRKATEIVNAISESNKAKFKEYHPTISGLLAFSKPAKKFRDVLNEYAKKHGDSLPSLGIFSSVLQHGAYKKQLEYESKLIATSSVFFDKHILRDLGLPTPDNCNYTAIAVRTAGDKCYDYSREDIEYGAVDPVLAKKLKKVHSLYTPTIDAIMLSDNAEAMAKIEEIQTMLHNL